MQRKFLLSSPGCQVGMTKDNIMLHFLQEEYKYFPCSAFLKMKKDRGVRFVVDNLQWGEGYGRNVVTRV
jgi:hypothetical protein